MFKSLRAPERLFSIATWAVTLVFASFLIGLGGKLVADLPGVDRNVTVEQFILPGALARLRTSTDSLEKLQSEVIAERERASLAVTASSNAYQSKREAFDNWIATRTATTDPQQDPEVVRRTRELDGLQEEERKAQAVVEAIDARQLQLSQAQQAVASERQQLDDGAQGTYQRALFQQELRVFGIRLALTLPLLIVGWWLMMRKRKSQYWPLARGFILFALFAFFFELVPYLPSYGGYVRYAVGIALTAVAGHYVIRAMQRYVAKRAVAEQQTENERRQALGYEEAMKKMSLNLCPGCDRPVPGSPPGSSNFCVHCGMKLYDDCPSCGTHKNAFYQYCPTCGVSSSRPAPEAPAAVTA
ncbi:MAG: zinc ribbon domain-containing protein [Gemmatimonadaceae bacterium]